MNFFYRKIQGKGCHGSMPNNGVDSVTIAAHIITALQELHARELAGTIRTYDEEVRAMLKQRMTEISQNTALTFRGLAEVSFGSGCPCLYNAPELASCTFTYVKELLGDKAFSAGQLNALPGNKKAPKSAGSEDFAYISQKVPSIMLELASGREFGVVMILMSVGMLSGFLILIPFGKKLSASVNKTENASTWKYVLSGTFMLCLFAVYIPVLLFGDTIQAAVMITGLVIAVALGMIAAKSPKLRWLGEFIMAFSMIGGMISSILWTNLFQ